MSFDPDSCCPCSCPCTNCCVSSSSLPARPLGVTRKKTFQFKNDSHLIVQCLEWEPRQENSVPALSTPVTEVDDRFVTSSAVIGSFVDRSALPPPCVCRCECGKKDKHQCHQTNDNCASNNEMNGNSNESSVNTLNPIQNPVESSFIVTNIAEEGKRSTHRPATANNKSSEVDRSKSSTRRPRVADFRFSESNNNKQIHRRLKIDSFHRKREAARLNFTLEKAGGIANTRDFPTTLVSSLSQKPPFHGYGEGNTKPVNGGVIYGDYLKTHNIKPDLLPNHPIVPQSTSSARYQLERKRMENLKFIHQLKSKVHQYYTNETFPQESDYWSKEYQKPLFAHENQGRSLWNVSIGSAAGGDWTNSTGTGTGTGNVSPRDKENYSKAYISKDSLIGFQSSLTLPSKKNAKEFFVPMVEITNPVSLNTSVNTTVVKSENNSHNKLSSTIPLSVQKSSSSSAFQHHSKQFQATFAWQ
jgi:hypothetical protein